MFQATLGMSTTSWKNNGVCKQHLSRSIFFVVLKQFLKERVWNIAAFKWFPQNSIWFPHCQFCRNEKLKASINTHFFPAKTIRYSLFVKLTLYFLYTYIHVRWLAPFPFLCSIVECAGWREIQNSIYWMGKVGSTCLMEYAFVLFSLSLQSCSFSQLWQCNFEVWSLKFGLFCFEKVGSTCLMEYAFFLSSLSL